MATTFHLTPKDCWSKQRTGQTYTPEPFATEGFIHCTDGEDNVVAVGNRYYAGVPREMICLVIDCNAVKSEIRYEDPDKIYPHIYGPLNTDAVREVREVVRAEDGTFTRLGDAIQM